MLIFLGWVLYRGGPAVRARLWVSCWPEGVTQVTSMLWPGLYLDTIAVSELGEPTAWPFTAVMTDPAVMPIAWAGLPQIVPMIRVPELTLAIWSGTLRPL